MRVFKDSDFKKIDGHVCRLPQGGLRQVLIEKWIRENCKNYDLPKILSGDDNYYSNDIGCDAFGRQVGQALRQENPNANTSQIFKKIRDFDIEDEDALVLLETYTSNQVKEKSRRKFIRALYDFIEGNED